MWLNLRWDTTELEFVAQIDTTVSQLTGRRRQLVDRIAAVAALQQATWRNKALVVIDEVWRASDIALFLAPHWGNNLLFVARSDAVVPPGTSVLRTSPAERRSEAVAGLSPEPASSAWRPPAAGHTADLVALVTDLNWISRRIQDDGVAAALLDLSLVDDVRAARLARQLRREAALYAEISPPDALPAILASRLDEPGGTFTKSLRGPRLVPHWPVPDRHRGLRHRLRSPNWPRAGYGASPSQLAVAPDGSWFAATNRDPCEVLMCDPVTGECVPAGVRQPVFGLAVTPDGTRIAGATAQGSVGVWDRRTGRQTHEFEHESLRGTHHELAIAPDGTWLAAGCGAGVIVVGDMVSGELRHALDMADGMIRALVTGGDGTWLAACADWKVQVWDSRTGRLLATVTDRGGGRLAVTKDGGRLVVGLVDGSVLIWEHASGSARRILTDAVTVHALYVAPDDSWLAVGGDNGHLSIWDIQTGRLRRTMRAHHGQVRQIVGHDRWIAVTTSKGGTVVVWDAVTGTVRNVLPQGGFRAALAVSPEGDWLAAQTSDGSLNIWDLSFDPPYPRPPREIGELTPFVPPDKAVWTEPVVWDGPAWLWDADPEALVASTSTPDGHLLAETRTGGPGFGEIRVSEASTGRLVTAMRVAGPLDECRWRGPVLYARGANGVYAFVFVPE